VIGAGPGGAVAGGSPLTVEAGLRALQAGGNAVDAAVAAQLMACVSEPLLTGLGGGGLAIVRHGDRTQVLDAFSAMPGLGEPAPGPHAPDVVTLDFGPDTQSFLVGPATAAPPGLPQGLVALHQGRGLLTLAQLAEPAARAARRGVPVTVGFARAVRLLWPIVARDPHLAEALGPGGEPLDVGDSFRLPALGDTLERLAAEGAHFLTHGDGARAVLARLGPAGCLTGQDLQACVPIWRAPLQGRYRGRTVSVPGAPSAAGAMVLRILGELEAGGPLPPPLDVQHAGRLIRAMDRALGALPGDYPGRLAERGYLEAFVGSGHTTHVSAVDGDGNAVGITSSLGETAGVLVQDTGVVLNNFLGEADVNPPDHPRAPGERLVTMCCPTTLEGDSGLYVMGAGGSSRIRSAVTHGVVFLSDHNMSAQEAVQAPRLHLDEGTLRVEIMERPPGFREALSLDWPRLIPFERHGMYFGGLHMAGRKDGVFTGGGDPRRTGSWASTGRAIGVGEAQW